MLRAPTATTRDGLRLLLSGLCVAGALVWVAGPLFDGDLWWHVRLGQEIIDQLQVRGAGLGWSVVPPVDGSWTTTQWLSEVLMVGAYKTGGWAALGWLRLVGEVLLLASIAWAVLRGRSLRAAAAPFCIAVIGSAVFVQDRPQQITYILCPIVGLCATRFLAGAALPPPAAVLPVVWVWAQFHPGWILAPAVLAVLIVGAFLDGGGETLSSARVQRALWLFPSTLVVGLLTPAGLDGIRAGGRIEAAARGTISEWQPANFGNINPVLLVLLVGLAVLSWALHEPRPRRSELLMVAALLAFGVMAFRNVVPAMLMLAPLVAGRRDLALAVRDEPRALTTRGLGGWRAATVGVLAVGLLVAAVVQARSDPFSGDKAPTRILAEVQSRAPVRVVPTYDLGGFFAGLGGPGVLVGIDGRTDYYGADYIRDYAAMVNAKQGWTATFDALDADVVVLKRTDALVGALETEGWKRVLTEKDFVILEKGTTA